eukprot:comp86482_c0_seq1/m.48478 comp86482_c0_seq1/g.48478  ORF comp86482_c0_seq1/g.48478 comp86482_c0_seq1/m.48478 type:complete len:249 (-) comp86482_c0_seq1:352-1098(-)
MHSETKLKVRPALQHVLEDESMSSPPRHQLHPKTPNITMSVHQTQRKEFFYSLPSDSLSIQCAPTYAAFRAHADKRNDHRVRFRKAHSDRVFLWVLPNGVAVSKHSNTLDSKVETVVPYAEVVAVSVSDITSSSQSRTSLGAALSIFTGSRRKSQVNRPTLDEESRNQACTDADYSSEGARSKHSSITPESGKILGVELRDGTKDYYAMEPSDADAVVAHIIQFRKLDAGRTLPAPARVLPFPFPLVV